MARLNRTLGLPSLLFYGVGVIIGAGIYSIIGAAAGEAGHGVWLSLLLAAIPAGLAALCYAELCTRFPRAGASYVYVREAFPKRRWASFIIGFIVAATAAATAATVSIAFAGYFALFVPIPLWISALALLAICTAINIVGIRESAWVTAIATSIEVLGLVLIIGAALAGGQFADSWLSFVGSDQVVASSGSAAGFAGIFAAAALCFFVYTGFEGLANLAEETRRPSRNLPLALLVSVVFTTIMYILVAIAATSLVEPGELAASDSPLATAAAAMHPKLATALGWIALFATANTALITLVVGSRLLYGMAEDGDLPAAVGRTLQRRRTPWVAALVVFAATATMLPLGDVAVVGSVSSLLTLIDFLAVGAAMIILRRRDAADGTEAADVFRVPLSIAGVPIVPVLLAVSIVLLASRFEWRVYAVAAGLLVLGTSIGLARWWWSSRTAAPRAMECHP